LQLRNPRRGVAAQDDGWARPDAIREEVSWKWNSPPVHALQHDCVDAVDRDQGIRSNVDNRDPRREIVGSDPERRNVQQVLTARRVGVEVRDRVVAEARAEHEHVETSATAHRIIAHAADEPVAAAAADQGVIAEAAVERVVARPARECVGERIAGHRVVAVPAPDVLDACDRGN
jgi:ribosomal protein S8E